MNEQQIKFLLALIGGVLLCGLLLGRVTTDAPLMAIGITVSIVALSMFLFRGIDTTGLNPFHSLFYTLFLLSMVLIWSPFKFAAYLAPMLFLGLMTMAMAKLGSITIAARLFIITLLWAMTTFLYAISEPDFVVQNSIISYFTYSSFFPLVIIPSAWIGNRLLLDKVVKAVAIVVVIQSLIGFVQFGYGLIKVGSLIGIVGDHVEGTIHLPLIPSASAATSMYSVNMALCVCILAAAFYQGARHLRIPIILGFFTFIMTDRVHVIATFLGALVVAYLLTWPGLARGMRKLTLVTLVILFGSFSWFISRDRVSDSQSKMEKTYAGKNEKFELYKTVLFTLPDYYPWYFITGLGPGQFCSRASAIAAGFLGYLPPPFKFSMSEPFSSHGIWLWHQHYATYWRGSIERPSSSWASVFSEFGSISFFVLFIAIGVIVLRIIIRSHFISQRNTAFCLVTGIGFLFGLGLSDFYWETCQMMFLGVMMLKIYYASFLHPQVEAPDKEEKRRKEPITSPVPV